MCKYTSLELRVFIDLPGTAFNCERFNEEVLSRYIKKN